MKKILILLFAVIALNVSAQETPPAADFKTITTHTFKLHDVATRSVWMYMGSTFGWINLMPTSTIADSLQYYRLLTNHDSLTNLQEKSYNSLSDLPDLTLKANVADPTFTTKITTPTLNITSGATLNYIWKCTNAATGAGAWTSIATNPYLGTWSAATNTPTLADGSGTSGTYYKCVAAGTVDFGAGNITFSIGDEAYYNGSIWQRVPAGASQWVTTGSDIYYNTGKVLAYKDLDVGNSTDGANLFLSGKNTVSYSYNLNTKAGDYLSITSNKAGAIPFKIDSDGGVSSGKTDISGAFATGTTKALTISNTTAAGSGNEISTSYYFKSSGWTNNLQAELALITDGYSSSVLVYRNHDLDEGAANDLVERLRITKEGYLGIAKSNPGTVLDVNGVITATSGNSTQWNSAYTHSQIAGGNSVHVSTAENTEWDAAYTHTGDNTQAHSDYLLNNANDVTTGTLTAVNFILSSDSVLKKNIQPIKKLSKFRKIDFVRFNLKSEPGQLRYGVIAQDVEKIVPELVRTDENGMKSVAYVDLLVVKVNGLEKLVNGLICALAFITTIFGWIIYKISKGK